MIYSSDESALLNKICNIIIIHGNYQSVWVGFADKTVAKLINPVAYFGFNPGYLESLNLSWSGSNNVDSPEAMALRSGNYIIKRNIISDPDMSIWKDIAIKHEYKSVIVLPLINKNDKLGVISIYSNNIEAFDNDEINILKELANDLVYGIVSRRLLVEHKLLEEELLKESKDRYKALFFSSRDAIMTIEPPFWNYTSGNPAALKMFNIKNEKDFINKTPSEFSPEFQTDGTKSTEKSNELIKIALNKGENNFEWIHKRIGGEEFPSEVTLSKVEMNGSAFIQSIVRDISDRKKLERQLKESEDQKFRTIFNSTNDGMILVSVSDQHFVLGNTAIFNMLGYSEEEFNKLHVKDIHPKENYDDIQKLFNRQMSGELKILIDIPVLRKDKSILYVDITTSEITIDNKKCILGVFRDTSDRRSAKEALEESEKKYFNLIENLPDSVAIYNSDKKLIFINKECLHLFGAISVEKLIGESIMKFIHPDSLVLVKERIKKSLNKKIILDTVEEKFLRLDGSSIIAEVKSMPIIYENKHAVLIIMRDITDRKNLEESKISFLSIASHQLRTPLSMMKWTLDSLLDENNYNEKQLKKINNLILSNERLINLVEKLLKATMIETGEMLAKKSIVDLKKLINDLVISIKDFASTNNKSIEVSIEPNLSLVYCDPILINESIKNFLTNAIIYSEEGSETVSIAATEREKDFMISVHNDGFIENEFSNKIKEFNKFSRGPKSQRISPSGSGLGLYITKRMVEVNGGTIGFTSDKKSGTTFYFTIIKQTN